MHADSNLNPDSDSSQTINAKDIKRRESRFLKRIKKVLRDEIGILSLTFRFA